VHVTILSVFVVCVTLVILLPGNNKPWADRAAISSYSNKNALII
jgi:hypothetical protein